jgi:hypothetical protein
LVLRPTIFFIGVNMPFDIPSFFAERNCLF